MLGRGSPKNTVDSGVKGVAINYEKGEKMGSDSAKAKLVEFSDFQCPACLAAEPAIKQALATYPDNLQFIYRHFPLPQHKNGRVAATLAEAAGAQGKFWDMHDKLFDSQSDWSVLPDPKPYFLELSKSVNLDEEKIKQALENNTFKSKIDDDVAEGQSLGVNSTPTFFLNGKKLKLQNFSDLSSAIEQSINEK